MDKELEKKIALIENTIMEMNMTLKNVQEMFENVIKENPDMRERWNKYLEDKKKQEEISKELNPKNEIQKIDEPKSKEEKVKKPSGR